MVLLEFRWSSLVLHWWTIDYPAVSRSEETGGSVCHDFQPEKVYRQLLVVVFSREAAASAWLVLQFLMSRRQRLPGLIVLPLLYIRFILHSRRWSHCVLSWLIQRCLDFSYFTYVVRHVNMHPFRIGGDCEASRDCTCILHTVYMHTVSCSRHL